VLFSKGPQNTHLKALQVPFENESKAQIWKVVGEH